jgi:hypothetical protein
MGQKSRTPLTKSQRFRIFRRDGFQCQYCGRVPPDAVLRVDHIVPVADGGTNDEDNLTTACHDCNAGKGRSPLSPSLAPFDADLRFLETQQRLAELRRYREAKAALESEMAPITSGLRDYWRSRIGPSWAPTQDDFRYLLDDHDADDIEKAIWIASRRTQGRQPSDSWSYTLAILRNWRMEAEGKPREAEQR